MTSKYNQLTAEAINILNQVREKIKDDSDFVWTSYENAKQIHDDIDNYTAQLEKGNKEILPEIYSHFLPTSTFQEHAIANDWTKEYHIFAEEFDKIYIGMKKS